jgi:outer membrane protein OmpA-like peptidoglycan-associated protein
MGAAAQTPDIPTGFRIGAFGAIGYNYSDAEMQRFISVQGTSGVLSRDFSKGSSIAPYAGITAEYLFGRWIGVGLRAAYDDRSIAKATDGSELSAKLAYLSFEPSLRFNMTPAFYFNAGGSVSIPVIKKYDYTPGGTEGVQAVSGADMNNVQDVAAGAFAGFGYDIPLGNSGTASRWFLTPFVEGSYMFDQKKVDVAQSGFDKRWNTITGRAGFALKFATSGPAEITQAPPPVAPSFDVNLRTPRAGVLAPRQLEEHMPLVNYLFFEDGSTAIPSRYVALDRGRAASFSESRLPELAGTGSSGEPDWEVKQMGVYYNMLNIFGSRLAKNPGSTITLVGSAPDEKQGEAMAEEVKSYLVATFGIDEHRIATEGRVRPPHASGTRATPKEDLGLVAEENRRVEILTDDKSLLAPVPVKTEPKEMVANEMQVSLTSDAAIGEWSMRITGDGANQSYGPFRGTIQRINATPILGDRARGSYSATITAKTSDGKTMTKTVLFELKKTEQPPMPADRYSILFEYDESKSVDLYENFLRNEVAPHLPNGSMVFVHGHTDAIGDESYNDKLSLDRAQSTVLILEDETKKLGRTVMFDTFGYGEADSDMLFSNESPEGRHYNRTVVIDILPAQ